MVNNKYYRKYVRDLINLDPTNFKQIVEVKVSDGFGGYKTIKSEVAIKARIYKNSRNLTFVKDAGVSINTSLTVKALCATDVVVQEGEILKTEAHDYKVVLYKNYSDVCIQLELEVIR